MIGIVLFWAVIYLTGMLLCKIGREKETSQLWIHLTGFFFLFFCQGVVFNVAQFLGWEFQKASLCLTGFLLFCSLLAIIVCTKEIKQLGSYLKTMLKNGYPYGRYGALFFWIFLGYMMVVATSTVGNRNDAMVEIVNTTLRTNTMNQFHPFTGQPLELGMIMSKKIITLPFWYSTLSVWTGFDATQTVWVLGTIVTAWFSLMAFGELARLLFHGNFKRTWLLLVLLELLYLSGDYDTLGTGYRQLFYGYSGEMIVATVLLPTMLCIWYRLFGSILRDDFSQEKEGIGMVAATCKIILCFCASLFLTSFVWGIGMLLMALFLFVICVIGVGFTKKYQKKEGTDNG